MSAHLILRMPTSSNDNEAAAAPPSYLLCYQFVRLDVRVAERFSVEIECYGWGVEECEGVAQSIRDDFKEALNKVGFIDFFGETTMLLPSGRFRKKHLPPVKPSLDDGIEYIEAIVAHVRAKHGLYKHIEFVVVECTSIRRRETALTDS